VTFTDVVGIAGDTAAIAAQTGKVPIADLTVASQIVSAVSRIGQSHPVRGSTPAGAK
jgi:hypothetical protein